MADFFGGSGNDTHFGTENADLIYGNDGEDSLYGEAGRDTIYGGEGDDLLAGRAGNDKLTGGSGADTLVGGTGDDRVFGGRGNDDILLYDGDVTGFETLYGGNGTDRLITYFGSADLRSSDIRDIESLTIFDDDSTQGRNILRASQIGDMLAQDLILTLTNTTTTGAANDAATLQLRMGSESALDLSQFQITTDLESQFLEVRGDQTSETIQGSSIRDVILTRGGDDTAYGGQGDDEISATSGANHLLGDSGNDRLTGGSDADRLEGGTGLDTLSGGAGNDLLYGQKGLDTLTGGEGDDRLYGGNGGDTLSGGTGLDQLRGGKGADRLLISSPADLVAGEVYNGGGGANHLILSHSGAAVFDFTGVTVSKIERLVANGDGGDLSLILEGAHVSGGNFGNGTAGLMLGNLSAYDDVTVSVAIQAGDQNPVDLAAVDMSIAASSVLFDITGNGEANTILGNTGGFGERIIGGRGGDVITQSSDDSTISGGRGNDVLTSLGDRAQLSGGDGSDIMDVQGADSTVFGGNGADHMILTGSGLRAYGGSGADTFEILGENPVEIDGGDGLQDTLDLTDAYTEVDSDFVMAAFVDLDAGTYSLALGSGSTAGPSLATGIENVIGGTPDDTFHGNGLNNQLTGMGGEDTLFGLGGDDRLYGGAGNDILEGNAGQDQITGGAGDDTVEGNADNDTVFGGSGNDLVRGNADDDTLLGGLGADTLYGGGERDWLSGGKGTDTLFGGTGRDVLYGGEAADVIVLQDSDGTIGNEILDGGTGVDTLRLHNDASSHSFDLRDASLRGFETLSLESTLVDASETRVILEARQLNLGLGDTGGFAISQTGAVASIIEIQMGSSRDLDLSGRSVSGADANDHVEIHGDGAAETITGTGARDLIYGGAGDDTLVGTTGGDSLYGGGGADLLLFVDGVGALNGGGGGTEDTADFSGLLSGQSLTAVTVNLEDETISYTLNGVEVSGFEIAGVEHLVGGGTSDTFTGDDENNVLNGGGGSDHLAGRAGADDLSGRNGTDTLQGGSGDDLITGGRGADMLTGGSGADAFIYTAANHSSADNRDTITDFERGDDVLDLSGITLPGNASFDYIGSAGFSGTAGELRGRVTSDGQNMRIIGDLDGDGNADFEILLEGITQVSQGDFAF